MATLNPAPGTLGLASPALGPWFDVPGGSAPQLAPPGADLSVAVDLPDDGRWLTPANALRSYAVADTAAPRTPLVGLRAADGTPGFTTGNLVVLVTLLPEVEARLHALSSSIPAIDGSTPGVPTRPRVRYLAAELPVADIDDVAGIREDPPFPSDVAATAEKEAYLGLTSESGALATGTPVRDLRRPDTDSATLLHNRTGAQLSVTLWAFDHRGRPVDPGAVAAWWGHLAGVAFDNLWASDDTADQRTSGRVAGKVVHLVDGHEGPLRSEHRARLTLSNLTESAAGAPVLTAAANASIGLTPHSSSGPDPMPLPRVALLPHGDYAAPAAAGSTLLSGWDGPAWPGTLDRDQARIAVVDIESHTIGVDRSAARQQEPTTSIEVRRNTGTNPVRTTIDGALDAVLAPLRTGSATTLMSPTLDAEVAPVITGALHDNDAPEQVTFTAHTLVGSGTSAGDTAAEQSVVLSFEGLPGNCWVRAWPRGIDPETGRHRRITGGAGRSDDAGTAHVVVPLPDGGLTSDLLGSPQPREVAVDVLVVTGSADRVYATLLFERPAVSPGAPVSPDGDSAHTVWNCEAGAPFVRGSGSLTGAEHLVAVPDSAGGTFVVVDRGALADADFDDSTPRVAAGLGDTFVVTRPAFVNETEGSVTDAASGAPATVVRRERSGFTELLMTGGPLPTMERREVVAVDLADGSGAVGAAPVRSGDHEAPPAQLGHPGVPAAAETHACGVALAGPAVVPLEVLMRQRRALSTADFVRESLTAPAEPNDPGGTTTWAAVLETIRADVAGDVLIDQFLELNAGFLPGGGWLALKDSIESAVPVLDLDAVIDSASFDDDDLAAALDRHITTHRDGRDEGPAVMAELIGHAEDLVYLETPALDSEAGGVDVLAAIENRLTSNPALTVVLCVSERLAPHTPRRLEDIRIAAIGAALHRLLQHAPDRVVAFTPHAGAGRRLHMASTTLVVDDAVLLTGTTHPWRRGRTFDSSVAVSLFDENVAQGRPREVLMARRRLVADRLGVDTALLPDVATELAGAIRLLAQRRGGARLARDAFPVHPDGTSTGDRAVWNPDGGDPAVLSLLLGAVGTTADDLNNAVAP